MESRTEEYLTPKWLKERRKRGIPMPEQGDGVEKDCLDSFEAPSKRLKADPAAKSPGNFKNYNAT